MRLLHGQQNDIVFRWIGRLWATGTKIARKSRRIQLKAGGPGRAWNLDVNSIVLDQCNLVPAANQRHVMTRRQCLHSRQHTV
jgi:hypothetical protein